MHPVLRPPWQVRAAIVAYGLTALAELVRIGWTGVLATGGAQGPVTLVLISSSLVAVGIWAGVSYGLFQGRNWVRVLFIAWALIVLISVSREMLTRTTGSSAHSSAVMTAGKVFSAAMTLAAGVLLITTPANQWFRTAPARAHASRNAIPTSPATRRSARACVVISVLLFVASLTVPAFRTDTDSQYGIAALVMGPLEFLAAPLLGLPWLANPILGVAWLAIATKGKTVGLIGSAVAVGLALLFAINGEIVESEAGGTSPVISLSAGYFLWVFSMLTALAGALMVTYRGATVDPS